MFGWFLVCRYVQRVHAVLCRCVSEEHVLVEQEEEGTAREVVVVAMLCVEWLSRWLLMAHWRCAEAFDLPLLSLLLACPPSIFSSRFLVHPSAHSLTHPRPSLSVLAGLSSSYSAVRRGGSSSSLLLSFVRSTNTRLYRVSPNGTPAIQLTMN